MDFKLTPEQQKLEQEIYAHMEELITPESEFSLISIQPITEKGVRYAGY